MFFSINCISPPLHYIDILWYLFLYISVDYSYKTWYKWQEVDALNQEKTDAGVRKISARSPLLYLGYFPLKSILEKLQEKKYTR